jgi:hypothetical protein
MKTPDIFSFCADVSEAEVRVRLLRRRLDNFAVSLEMSKETVVLIDAQLLKVLELLIQVDEAMNKLPESRAFMNSYRIAQGFEGVGA